MSAKIEVRSLQIRAAQGEEFVLAGRALSYNEISSNELAPGFRERIMPGAFADSLASGRDVKALLNHDSRGLPLGRLANGTLKISDSVERLDFKIQLDRNNTSHCDVYASVKRGDLSECSFAFVCEEEDATEGYTKDGQRCLIRNVRKAQLQDVSVVASPVYGDNATFVDARNVDAWKTSVRARLAAINEKFESTIWSIRTEARLKAVDADMKKQPGKAADPVNESLDEYAANDEFFSMRLQDALNRAHGKYRVVGRSDSYLYAVDADEEESAVHRWAYSCDANGDPIIDQASKAQMTAPEVSAVRGLSTVLEQRRADRALRFRMQVAAGVR